MSSQMRDKPQALFMLLTLLALVCAASLFTLWGATSRASAQMVALPSVSSSYVFPPYPLSDVPASTGFDYPVGGAWHYEGFTIYNCFGCDLDTPGFQGHTGEDFFNNRGGDPVYSVSEGKVIFSGMGPGLWGNIIIIQHKVRGVTVYSQYAHLTTSYVSAGQVVGRRQVIGTVGMTGTTEPHLHFEIKDLAKIGHGYTGIGFSGLTIYSNGINYYKPSWYIESLRYLDSPYGAFDWVRRVPGGFKFQGWGFDPNTTEPIDIHIYVDGQFQLALTAAEYRPDIGQSFPGMGDYHGFSGLIAAMGGMHTVCAYGINKGAGGDNFIACQEIEVGGSPYGMFDGASLDGQGNVSIGGWAIDPDTAAPAEVKLTENGMLMAVMSAADYRDDVEEAYPEYGPWHGFTATLPVLAGDMEICAYGVSAGSGADGLLGCETISGGWDSFPLSSPPDGRHYYWPWFDSKGGYNWVLMASPTGGQQLQFDLNIAGKSLDLHAFGGPSLEPGSTMATTYGSLTGGPVVATSLDGSRAIASQRVLWGGSSIEEVPGIDEQRLSSHYYWTWYDQKTRGMTNWVLVANPNNDPVYYEITIGGEDPGPGSSGTIAPGENTTPTFPGVMDGPVEVRAWTDATRTATAKVIASQRVLSGGGSAFNEAPGIPEEELSSHYLWAWYDDAGGANWLLIANPSASEEMYYQVNLAGTAIDGDNGTPIPPGGFITRRYGTVGGPLEVISWKDQSHTQRLESIASQRVVWGQSFGETPGLGEEGLSDDYHWTWYDQKTPQMSNWVLVANPGQQPVYYEIRFAGVLQQGGTLAVGDKVTPTFPGSMAGPVEVRAWTDATKTAPSEVIASQRVLYRGYFNEVVGTVLG